MAKSPPDWTCKSPEELHNAGFTGQPPTIVVDGCETCPFYNKEIRSLRHQCMLNNYANYIGVCQLPITVMLKNEPR
jgi:hypothetical protein